MRPVTISETSFPAGFSNRNRHARRGSSSPALRMGRAGALALVAVLTLAAQDAQAPRPQFRGGFPVRLPLRLSQDFFACDNGTGRDQKVPIEDQATLLKNAGYAGMAVFTGTAHIPETLKALGDRQLRLLSIYVHSFVDESGPRVDPGLATAIDQLSGRETMILLTVRGGGANAESRAVEIVRQVADMAAKGGLRVCLYPHIGYYVETTPDAVRVARKAGRRNVGVALNLYHTVEFHRTRCGGTEIDFSQLVQQSLPDILLVSINGMRRTDEGLSAIVRLDEGEYDVSHILRALNNAGYTGPVALLGYQVPGDIRENLEHSMEAWKALLAKITGPDMPGRPASSRRPKR